MDTLNQLSDRINKGIDDFEQLYQICMELISVIEEAKLQGNSDVANFADALFEKLRPEWNSPAFYAWMIGESCHG
jgi:hypothetical protein